MNEVSYVYYRVGNRKEYWEIGNLTKGWATVAKYEYEHQGLRYKKIDNVKNQTTIYIYGAGNEPLYEEIYDNGTYTTPIDHASYLYMGTRRVARDDSKGLAYIIPITSGAHA